MIYDVWDGESANIVGAFESQREALEALDRALDEHGSDYVSLLVLGCEDDAGESTLIATGDDLVKLVLKQRENSPHQSGSNGIAPVEEAATPPAASSR